MSERHPSFVCPGCNQSKISVYYVDPLAYTCGVCKVALIDDNDPGIPVLTREEGRSKRPAMFGEEACVCTHALHEMPCELNCRWCVKAKTPHVYKFRLGGSR